MFFKSLHGTCHPMTGCILSNRIAIFAGVNLVCATFLCLAETLFHRDTHHRKINYSKTWKKYSRVNYKERVFVCCTCSWIASKSFAAPKTYEFTQFVGLDSQTQVRSYFKTYFALSRHARWDNFWSYLVYKLIKSTKSIQLVVGRKYVSGEILKIHKKSAKGSILEQQLSSTDGFLR